MAMADFNVIDISGHQAAFSPAAARAAGVDAVILRHAYGAGPDALALSWAQGVRASGLALGGYGFATWHYAGKCGGSLDKARALMRQQVQAWIAAAAGTRPGFWFAVDQELESGQRMGLGKADNTALLNEACSLLAAAGLHPCVYCSVSWDIAYIRTADLQYPQWMARYCDGAADFGAAGADLAALPDGQYTRWMRQLHGSGRLVGWQFASTGLGVKYGAGSAGIDRSVFYAAPAAAAPAPEAPVPEPSAQYIAVGPASTGDIQTVCAKLDSLAIPYTVAGDTVRTDVPCSTGDQAALIALAVELCIGVRLTEEKPGSAPQQPDALPQDKPAYSVVFVGLAVKGGFDSREDALDYIRSILGPDACGQLGLSVQEV